MKHLIYPRDRSLTILTMALGVLLWVLALTLLVRAGGARSLAGALGIVLLVCLLSFLAYLFARSTLIAHVQGNGVELTPTQLPQLYQQFAQCCERLAVSPLPRAYILNGNGVLNAFATWFLGRKYVVLLSSVVDAMDENSNGVRFYIGHELAHVIRHDNPLLWALRWPALLFPLLGAGFSRARETTCDLHGLGCSDSREGAARSLLALSAGARHWKDASLPDLEAQLRSSQGFWASFHELTASYPWNSKRVLRVLQEQPAIPRRNPFAYLLAAFVPYAGKLGSGLGMLIYVYVIGVLAAIAIPAYQDYTVRAQLTQAMNASQRARSALAASYESSKVIPASLDAVGIEARATGMTLSVDPKNMILTVETPRGTLLFTPRRDPQGHITWTCTPGTEIRPGQLPPSCRH